MEYIPRGTMHPKYTSNLTMMILLLLRLPILKSILAKLKRAALHTRFGLICRSIATSWGLKKIRGLFEACLFYWSRITFGFFPETGRGC